MDLGFQILLQLQSCVNRKSHLMWTVVLPCPRWEVTRARMELSTMQCVAWSVGEEVPAALLKAILEHPAINKSAEIG